MIQRAPAARESDACPTCGSAWSGLTTGDGRVVVVCDRCGGRELVTTRPPPPPRATLPPRVPLTLSKGEVRAIAQRITRGESSVGKEVARFAGAIREEELRAMLRQGLGEVRYAAMVEAQRRRGFVGR